MDPETRTVLASSGLAGFEQALNGLGVQRLEDLELLTSDDLSKIGMTVIQTRKYAQAVKTAQDRISQAEAAAQDSVDAHRSNSISNTDSVSRASSERDEKKKGIRHTFAAFPFRNKKKAAKGSPTFSDSASFESGERSSFGTAPRSFFSRDKKPTEAQRDDGGGYNDGGHEDGRESIMDPSLKLDVRVVRVSQWDYNQSLEASTNTIAVLHMYKGHTAWTRMETKSGPSKQNLKFGSLYYTSEVTRDVGNTTVKVPVVKAVAQVRASVAQVMGVLLLESSERMQERLPLLDGTYVNGQIMRIVAPRSKDGKSSSYTYPKLPLCTIKRSCHLLPDTKQLRDFVFRDSYEMRLEDGKQIGVRSMVSVELGECANRGSAQVVRGTIHEGSGIVVVPISEDHCEVCFVLAATTDTKSSSIFSTKTARALKHLEAMVSFTDSIRVWVEGRLRRFGSLQNAEDFPPEVDVSGGDSSPLLTGISSKAASRLFSDTEAPVFNLQEPSSPTSRLASFPSEEVEDDSTGDEAEAEKDLSNLDEMVLCDAPPSLPAKPKVLPMMSSSISHNDSIAATNSDTHDETAKAQEGSETMPETSTSSTQLDTKPSPEKSVDALQDSVPTAERAVKQADGAFEVLEAERMQDTVPPVAPAANEMTTDESATKQAGANVEEGLAAASTSAEESGREEPGTQGGNHASEDPKAELADTCDDAVIENEAVSPGLLAALELSEPTTETSVAVEETVKAVEERKAVPSLEQDSTPLDRESVGEECVTTSALAAESVEVNELEAIDVVKDVIEKLIEEITGEAGETEGTTREETQNIQPTKYLDGGEVQLTLDIPNATTVIADIPVEKENNQSGATTPVTPVPSTKDEAMEKMKRELEDMRQKLKEKEENERKIRAELEERRRKSMAIRKGVQLDRLETDLDTIGEGENEDVTPPGKEPSSRESNASRHSAGSQGSLGSAGGQSMESGSPGGGGVHLEDEIRRLRRLLEITRPFLPEDFNEEDAHLTLAEAETRMRKALEILMGENISPAEMMQAQAEFERYDRIVSNHPEFKQREADKWQRWEEANATKNADALKEMRELVKERYFSSTPTDLEKEGVSPLLIKRIAQKKVFQLYYKSTEEIEKLHQVALLGTYSAQGLDIVEMRALYCVVPKTFANDPEGKKTQWRENLKQKLSELIRKEETNQLRGEEKRSRAYAKAPEPGKASHGGMPSIRTGGRGPPAGLAAALAKRGGGGPPGRGPPGRGPPAGLAAALAKRGGGDAPGRGPPAGLAEALAKRGGGPRPGRGPPAGLAEALAKRSGGPGPAGAPRGPPAGLAEALAKRAGAPRGPPAGLAEALAKRTGGAGGAGGAGGSPGPTGPARGPPPGLAEALAKRAGNGATTVAKPGRGPPAGLAEALAKRSVSTEPEQSNKSSSTEKAISPNILETPAGAEETPQPSVPSTKESAPGPSLEGKLEGDSMSCPTNMESAAKGSPVSDLDLMQTLEAEFGSPSGSGSVVEASQANSILSERPGSETSTANEAEPTIGKTLHQADKEEHKHPKSKDGGITAPPLPEKTVRAPTSSIEEVKTTTQSSDLPVGNEILPPANAAPFISPVKTSPPSPLAQKEDAFQDTQNGSTESPLASPSTTLNTSLPDLVSTSESSQANMTTMQEETANMPSATKEPLDLKPKGSAAGREANHKKFEPQVKRKDSVDSSNSNDELSEILQNTFGLGKKVKLGVTPSAPSQALLSGGPSATNTCSDIPSMDSLEARLQQEWQDTSSATASERSELKKEKQGSVLSSDGTGLSSPTLPPKPESLQASEKMESLDKKEKASKDDDWEADLMSSLSNSF